MRKLMVYDIDYDIENETPVIKIFCLDKDGNLFLVKDYSLIPYFYVLPKKGMEDRLKEMIEKIDEKKVKTKILRVEKVEKIIGLNEKRIFLKIFVQNPRKISKVRDEIKEWEEVEETYEYTINFYKRYLIDRKISPMSLILVDGEEKEKIGYIEIKANKIEVLKEIDEFKLRILAFDTEWVEEKNDERIIMISLVSNDGKIKKVLTFKDWKDKPNYVEVLKNERDLILRFFEILKEYKPHFLVGYNSDGFDFARLKRKIEKYKIRKEVGVFKSELKFVRRGRVSAAQIKGIVHIDLFIFVNHILAPTLKSEVLTLDEVAKELIGEGKKEMEYKDMIEIWSTEKGLTKLAEYNLQDSILTIKLANLLLPQIFEISRLVGEIPFDSSRYTYSQLVESYLVRRAFEENRIILNPPKQEEKEIRMMRLPYKGAIVIEPKEGIYSNILVWDFRSLYPSIIVTHNISPETLNCGHEECKKNQAPETKNYFCTKIEGFIPRNLKKLIELRYQIKKELKEIPKESIEYKSLYNRQYALKIISNATYGYFGFVGARWYKAECGEAAAAWGRFYIKKVIEEAKKKGFEIIYGDTDSLFARIEAKNEKELEEIGRKFTEEINSKLPGIIELEFRGLFKRGIFVSKEREKGGAKKRYALLAKDGSIEIRGFETVRRDWCELAKQIQRKVLEIILKEGNEKKAVEVVRETIEKLKKREVDIDDLVIYEQLTRPLEEYEQIGPHVKAAKRLMEGGISIVEGMLIGYVIVKGSGSISDRAIPAQFVSKEDYDTDYYIHHQILPAALRVLKGLGYTEGDILGKGKVKSLESFFGK
ncbi:MAG: DNA polymerase [Candidatus Aenigmarchaeota archaeon ex4484_224]|nr:MAG: DNA polymerase [Candidatus Aenigmarchaeota archaeon ex4484_224]